MTYFKPWHRQLGIVVLLLALAFVGAWVRSGVVSDDVVIRQSSLGHETFQSGQGRLLWGSFSAIRVGRTLDSMQVVMPRWSSKQLSPGDVLFFGIFESMPEGHHLCGVGEYSSGRLYPLIGPVAIKAWVVPYWVLAIPLTALSVWLLLSNPHPAANRIEASAFA